MAKETIIYIAIVTPLAIALGFDAFVGFAIVSIGTNIGFRAAVMNPLMLGLHKVLQSFQLFQEWD
ncbi:hypothetical protein [Cytobacillus purgationiresistens]|uniref:Ion transporter superfamily protein YfcC n=1 Tax=Cytobacillus purgationiresistens TaxID=863449 RepID=A0ABU0ABT3_9BACI|nr:hypothetical protein [Cytobacillus purgationiresistens]MDQ0268252.1 putative ion transporter superfamily protein YfcC [Cytobacillus purgationiresistens]